VQFNLLYVTKHQRAKCILLIISLKLDSRIKAIIKDNKGS